MTMMSDEENNGLNTVSFSMDFSINESPYAQLTA
jgi:hypothetical protein